ncbi:ATP-binding protein [Halospeciosus flavus]|uniref:ATP-binding protein n=1 Tax=Halospeciosus flavus TaxID=3032283 RepID=UPI002441FF64|nr:DUF87 domain-containing protein [Halospeciosus flavus]
MAEDTQERIHVGETPDGDPVYLPTIDILTGRGFLTGKSGAGKSNSVSVVIEELLDAGFPVLIVDQEGEYFGLKEQYELLHAGADEECDVQVSAEHAEKLATLALEENVPIILDVSGFLDEDESNELVRETARHLFAKEKRMKKPFLLVIEECHEYLPEGGGMDETGKMLIKVSKRGRKHGLGVVGVSQRPADVKKDFITQANWLVWHRLTWENDTKVVSRIVGSEYGDEVADLDPGEAFVQLDWTDEEVQRIQFKRKQTFDAGATPGLDDFERPDLKSVSDSLTEDLSEITAEQEARENRVAELENELEKKEARIADLKNQLEQARDVSAAARKMANALAHGEQHSADLDGDSSSYQSTLQSKNQEIDRLEDRVAELESMVRELAERDAAADATVDAGGPTTAEIVAETAEVRAETATTTGETDATARAATDGAAVEPPETSDETTTAAGTASGPDVPSDMDDDRTTSDTRRPPNVTTTTATASRPSRRTDGVSGSAYARVVGKEPEPVPDPEPEPEPEQEAAHEDHEERDEREGRETALQSTRAGMDTGPGVDADEAAEAIGYERRAWPTPDDPESDDAAEPSLSLSDVDPADDDEPLDERGNGLPEGGVEIEEKEPKDPVDRMLSELREKGEQLRAAEDMVDTDPDYPDASAEELLELADDPAVVVRVNAARRESLCNEDGTWAVVARLAADAPLTVQGVADHVGISNEAAHSLLTALRQRDLVTRDQERRYALDASTLRSLAGRDDKTTRLGELQKQWRVD